MTRSVYVIGGAGSGKSTFMDQLLGRLGVEMGPLTDLASKPNARGTKVTLRGHGLVGEPGEGLYIGCMRDSFPGTDGLDRASSIAGELWLELGDLPKYIVAEGATLASRRFIGALHKHTELLLVHLHADEFVKELRFMERGSNQAEQFVRQTATRSANLERDMRKLGVRVYLCDTADPDGWEVALRFCREWLG